MIWTVVVRVTIVPRFYPIFAVGLNFWCPGRIASVCTLKEVRDAAQAVNALLAWCLMTVWMIDRNSGQSKVRIGVLVEVGGV